VEILSNKAGQAIIFFQTPSGGISMHDFKRILVVTRMTAYCQKAVHYGFSLAKQYQAKLYIIHAVHNPFGIEGWNLGSVSLEKEYQKYIEKIKSELDAFIAEEQDTGVPVTVLVEEAEPTEEILRTVKEYDIDLIIMLSHKEGRIEHFLFDRSNEELIRKMPCSVLLLKKEPEPAT
jgi:universal stress protein A